jgi:hypothetical protein
MICLCGLDHNKPLPEMFEYPPIVNSYGIYDDKYIYLKANCHVCHSEWNLLKDEKEYHHDDCVYFIKKILEKE